MSDRIQTLKKKRTKVDWTDSQCEEIDTCLTQINSKKVYQLVKNLTSEMQGRSAANQDKSWKCLRKKMRFSADDPGTAQSYTTIRLWLQYSFGL